MLDPGKTSPARKTEAHAARVIKLGKHKSGPKRWNIARCWKLLVKEKKREREGGNEKEKTDWIHESWVLFPFFLSAGPQRKFSGVEVSTETDGFLLSSSVRHPTTLLSFLAQIKWGDIWGAFSQSMDTQSWIPLPPCYLLRALSILTSSFHFAFGRTHQGTWKLRVCFKFPFWALNNAQSLHPVKDVLKSHQPWAVILTQLYLCLPVPWGQPFRLPVNDLWAR